MVQNSLISISSAAERASDKAVALGPQKMHWALFQGAPQVLVAKFAPAVPVGRSFAHG